MNGTLLGDIVNNTRVTFSTITEFDIGYWEGWHFYDTVATIEIYLKAMNDSEMVSAMNKSTNYFFNPAICPEYV